MPTFGYRNVYPRLLSVSDFPSGFAYIASSLKEAGHEVTGLNLNNIFGYPSAYMMVANKVAKALEDKPDLIGTGGLCIDYAFLQDVITIIRHLAPDIPIVLGGGIVNNDAEFIFNDLKPDYAIVGEAEETFVKLANALGNSITHGKEGGEGNDLLQREIRAIDNLWYWEEE